MIIAAMDEVKTRDFNVHVVNTSTTVYNHHVLCMVYTVRTVNAILTTWLPQMMVSSRIKFGGGGGELSTQTGHVGVLSCITCLFLLLSLCHFNCLLGQYWP